MSIELKYWKFGFINCGELVGSIIYPLLKRGLLDPSRIWVADTAENIDLFRRHEQNFNVHSSLNSCQVASNVDIIFLGCEAHLLNHSLNTAILPSLPHENTFKYKLIVSLIPGVSCAKLGAKIAEYGLAHENVQIMRVMPNMPMTVGEGLILYCRNQNLSEQGATPVVQLFSHHGMVKEIEESLMDVAAYVPAICGPAYVYLMIDAMADGAVKNNLPRDLAIEFICQVFIGAAKMVLKSGKPLGQLKDEACIPDGPAIEGIHELEVSNLRASLINAIDAAALKLMKQKPKI